MALRIGCDLDGVLADMEGALAREAARLFGTTPEPRPQPDTRQLTDERRSKRGPASAPVADNTPLRHDFELSDRDRRRLWRHVRALENFWETLDETEPGIVRRLAEAVEERRWELIFLTRRPATAGAPAQVQSQRWLEAHGFPLPSVYVVTASRGLIAAGLTLDIVVDDTPENCVDVASESTARTIAIFRNPDIKAPAVFRRMGIHLARSAAQCLDLLLEIDSRLRQPKPGAAGRAMRLLGVKQQANA